MTERSVLIVDGSEGPVANPVGRPVAITPITMQRARAPERESADQKRQRDAAAKRARQIQRQSRGMS